MNRVVLVRTQGPRNAGLAARAVLNFAPAELWFVAPERDDLFESCEFYSMAHGVAERRTRFPVVDRLDEALADCHRSIGFTARSRQHRELIPWPELRVHLRRDLDRRPHERVALVFGNEQDGLDREETDLLEELAWIPTSEEHTSINLGGAVHIVLSELLPRGATPEKALPSRKIAPLSGEDRERLKRDLIEGLVPVVRGEPSRRDLTETIERLFSQARLETRDARAWHKLVRELKRWGPRDGDAR